MSIKSIFGVKETSFTKFIPPERQSIEQVENYSTKKVINTVEAYSGTMTLNNGGRIYLNSSTNVGKPYIYNNSANGYDIYINTASNTCVFGYTGFGIGGVTTDADIIFQVLSTVRGSIPAPAMTTAQKNTLGGLAPPEGTQVYDLTLHKICVWTGAAWETITSA